MRTRRRVDDSTAIIDWVLAHGILIGAILVAIAAGRLIFHPLRFARLSRVYIERGRVKIAPVVGAPREVDVVRVEHDGHSPWPCTLHLADGSNVQFVARRDSGFGALLDLEPSDRARYERPSDARDSLTDLELIVRR
jgi:hypothetical protein